MYLIVNMDKQDTIMLSNYSCICVVALNLAEPYLFFLLLGLRDVSNRVGGGVMGLALGLSLVEECIGVKLSLFEGALPGLEDVSNRVGSFVGGGVMGLAVGGSLVRECVGIKLGSFSEALLGLGDVGNRVGSFVGGGVMGLTVGLSLLGECVGCNRPNVVGKDEDCCY
jgi:hypothetical protein